MHWNTAYETLYDEPDDYLLSANETCEVKLPAQHVTYIIKYFLYTMQILVQDPFYIEVWFMEKKIKDIIVLQP